MKAEGSTGRGALGRQIAGRLEDLTLEKVTGIGFENAKGNAERIRAGLTLDDLLDTPLVSGDRALVVAAGPSLHRYDSARIIRESDFDGMIVTSESSMAWCLRNGIVPDLVVTLDPHPTRIVRWFGDPSLTEEMIEGDDYYSRQDMDPEFRRDQVEANERIMELLDRYGSRIRIAISSSASEAVARRVEETGMTAYWWNPMYDDYDREDSLTRKIHALNGLPCVNAGGNVGTACWVFAGAVLGKKQVGLAGMDFGYYEDLPYERTQYYYPLLDLVGEERLDEVFVWLTNPHMDRAFYTDPAYLWYRDTFLEMAGQMDCETVNCTGGGILFGDPIRWSGLEDFLRNKD
jgi:hypothetical protein